MTKTVLTVDDSRMMLDMLQITLAGEGYKVLQAEDGVAALEMLKTERPDVIITDINMPRLDGFGFIQQVRQRDHLRTTPILVLTTEVSDDKKMRARNAGATGWIVKPFNPPSLLDIVRRVAA